MPTKAKGKARSTMPTQAKGKAKRKAKPSAARPKGNTEAAAADPDHDKSTGKAISNHKMESGSQEIEYEIMDQTLADSPKEKQKASLEELLRSGSGTWTVSERGLLGLSDNDCSSANPQRFLCPPFKKITVLDKDGTEKHLWVRERFRKDVL